MTDTLIERVAKSDAEFDGRTWIGMPAAERKRYLARAEKSVAVVGGALAEDLDTEAYMTMEGAQDFDIASINRAMHVASALITKSESIRAATGVPSPRRLEDA